MTTERRKVLILGEDVKSFLTVVRSLGRHGLEVHTAWCPQGAPALKSKYIKVHHEIPLPLPFNKDWLNQFNTLLDKEDFALVIPTNDPTLVPLQLNRNHLTRQNCIYLLNDKAFTVAFSKTATFQLAEDLQIPQAPGTIISSIAEAKTRLASLSYPLVLRSRSSYEADNLTDRINVIKVHSREELLNALPFYLEHGSCLVQENFSGVGIGIEFIASHGQVLSVFQHERLHESISGGPSQYRKSVPLHPELLACSTKIIAALDYTGVGMIEFKYSPTTNRWIFIEINGRFWGSLPLTVAAGLDMPLYLYQLLVEDKRDFPQKYRNNIYCRNLANDVDWFRHNFFADKSDPALQTVPVKQSCLQWLRFFLGQDYCDTYAGDDRAPFWADLCAWAKGKMQAVYRAVWDWSLSSPAMGAKQRRILTQRVHRGSRLLFVCHGNICRSSFAEYYARRKLRNTSIASAGASNVADRAVPSFTQRMANESGIDLTNHRSRALSAINLNDFDLIFVFDIDNYVRIVARYPEHKSKLFFLWALTSETVIADPYGRDINFYRHTYTLIKEAIDQLALLAQRPEPKRAECVAQFIDTPGIGGAEIMVADLTNALIKNSLDTKLICLPHAVVADKVKKTGCPILPFPDYHLYKSLTTLPLFVWKFSRFLKANNISVLHAHLTGPVIAGGLACWWAGIPCVGTLHDTFIVKQDKLNLMLLRFVARRGTQLVTVSEHMANFYKNLKRFPASAITTIKNAVAPCKVSHTSTERLRHNLGIDPQEFVFVSVGRLVGLKRYDLLIEAFAKLAKANAILVLVGDGVERNNLEQLAQTLGVSSRVVFLGVRSDVNEILSLAHCFVLASEIEGLSRSILEAMAAGLPIVATDVGGNKELVLNNQNGLLVPAGDASALADALQTILHDSNKQKQFGQTSKQLAQKNFSLENMTKQYQELYSNRLR